MTVSNKDTAAAFLRMAASGEVRAAFQRHVAETFRHHNPYFAGTRQALLEAMEQSAAAEPNKSFEIKQTIEDGDTVAVFSHLKRVDKNLEYAVVHILRFAHGKIVELWDVGQEIPRDGLNELGMFQSGDDGV